MQLANQYMIADWFDHVTDLSKGQGPQKTSPDSSEVALETQDLEKEVIYSKQEDQSALEASSPSSSTTSSNAADTDLPLSGNIKKHDTRAYWLKERARNHQLVTQLNLARAESFHLRTQLEKQKQNNSPEIRRAEHRERHQLYTLLNLTKATNKHLRNEVDRLIQKNWKLEEELGPGRSNCSSGPQALKKNSLEALDKTLEMDSKLEKLGANPSHSLPHPEAATMERQASCAA